MNSLAIALSFLLLIFAVPIFMVFGLGSSATAIWGMGLPWSTLIQVSFGSVTKHVLLAVPLFIFAGMVMLRGGAAARLVHFATTLVGHWPGGLGLAMILAMGFFAAFCGLHPCRDHRHRHHHDPADGEPGLSKTVRHRSCRLGSISGGVDSAIQRRHPVQRADRCSGLAHLRRWASCPALS